MNKKFYYASFGIAPILCFLMALVTKFPLDYGCVDISDIAVFVVSAIFGPLVGLTCGVGVAISDIVSQQYAVAPFSGVIASLVGLLCGYLYRYAFSSMHNRTRKILALLCSAGASMLLWFVASLLICKDINATFLMFMFRALISLASGLLAMFILPKNPIEFVD